MAGVRVVTDSSCDLPPETVRERGIEVVPLTIRFGSEEFVDGQDLSPEQFWARMKSSDLLPETAAPSPGAFEEVFRKLKADGADAVISINLSSELSGTMQSAQVAADAVKDEIPVRVVDSRTLTIALGAMAFTAADLAEQGKGLDEIVAEVESVIPRIRIYAALDTLENLRKGGRIGTAQALIGSLLSMKPIIEVSKGFVEAESRQRTRAKSLRYLVDKLRAAGDVDDVFVAHGNAPDVETFLEMVGEVYPREKITVSGIGPVIGTHGGPGVIGLCFRTPA